MGRKGNLGEIRVPEIGLPPYDEGDKAINYIYVSTHAHDLEMKQLCEHV